MIDKSSLVKALRILTAAIDALDQQELDELISGRAKFVSDRSRKRKGAEKQQSIDQAAVIQKLNACKDREEARKVLSGIQSRNALASLARAQKIHVVKHD